MSLLAAFSFLLNFLYVSTGECKSYRNFDGATYICEDLKWFSVTPDEYKDNTYKTAVLKTVPLNNFGIKLEVMPYYSNIYIKHIFTIKIPCANPCGICGQRNGSVTSLSRTSSASYSLIHHY
jgi:hypothetical protein